MKKMSFSTSRVDIQVSIIILVIVAFSFLCVHFFSYTLTYDDMVDTLKERSDSIYQFIDKRYDANAFLNYENKSDLNSASYLDAQEQLANMQEVSNVRYLYTIQQNERGEYIYVIDGLALKKNEFRHPGTNIDEDMSLKIKTAYQGEIVYAKSILNSDSGPIFVTFYPLYENAKVIGVLGIEFDAEHQFNTFQTIQIVIPIMGIVFAIIAIGFSVFLFRRISNPHYKDFANTDYLTGMKNRNAFEVAIRNDEKSHINRKFNAFIVIDLNSLKEINDTLGHASGDEYIRQSAAILMEVCSEALDLYRIGGDEFVAVYESLSEADALDIMDKINIRCAQKSKEIGLAMSLSSGFAKFDEAIDKCVMDVYERADTSMYEMKKRYKQKKS